MTTMTEASVREFKMPDVGEGLTEAEILKWYVQPGDTVTDGQVVCEVETAKAAVELPIPYDGVVRDLHFPEGTTVDVGTAIIAVDVGGGAAPAPAAEQSAAVQPAAAAPAEESKAAGSGRQPVLVGYGVATSSTRRRPRKGPEVPVQQASTAIQTELNGHAPPAPEPAPAAAQAAPAGTDRPLAKPPVRKLAKDLGVDLTTVVPTGPDGIITREDVHAAVAAAVPAAPEPSVASAPAADRAPASYDTTRETRIPVKGVRKATAAAMVGSAFTAPHVTEFVTVDVTRTMKLVEELKADKEFAGLRVNPLLLIAKALLVAIKRNPDVNASWDEAAQEIVVKHYVNPARSDRAEHQGRARQDAAAAGRVAGRAGVDGQGRQDLPGGDAGRHGDDHQRRRLRRRHGYADPQPGRVRDPRGRSDQAAALGPQGQGEAPSGHHPGPVVRPPPGRR